MNMQKKKILQVIGITAAMVLGFIILMFFVFFYSNTKTYETQAQYKEAGGILLYEIPEQASDCRYAVMRTALSKTDCYSFSLDEASFAAFTESFAARGDDAWYGRTVQDYNADASVRESDRLPVSLPVSAVTDSTLPLTEYTIIDYSPTGTGSRSGGLLADAEHCRLVVFYRRNAA